MTVQFIEIDGHKVAVLPIADYERLLDAAEDRADENAAAEAERRRAAGEEFVPAALVDQLIAGDNALRVWRKHRGLTQVQLADLAGVRGNFISRLETGERGGSPIVWRSIANVLRVSVDDILPTA